MPAILRRLGYVDKKPKLVPGKADAAAPEAFLEDDENLKQTSDEDDVLMFMDATHLQHNPVISYGWIQRGKAHPRQEPHRSATSQHQRCDRCSAHECREPFR
jgi:hypothetical protein